MPEFVCECGAKKGSKEDLKSHICVKHLRWMPFECAHCSANNECAFEATKDDLLIHTHEIHPGREIKYTYVGDSHKEQLLKHKLQRSKNLVIDQNIPASDHQILIAPTEVVAKTEVITIDDEQHSKPRSPTVDHHLSEDVQAAADDVAHSTREALPIETTGVKENVARNSTVNVQSRTAGVEPDNKQLIEADKQEEIKPKPNYDSDDSGDDFEPSTPPSKSPIPEPEVKPELIVGDDDDFKPDPPASDMGDSQSQQQHVGQCSTEDAMGSPAGVGSSPQEEPSISGPKRSKLKRNVKEKKEEARRKKAHDGTNGREKTKSQRQQQDVGHNSAEDAMDSDDSDGSSPQQSPISGSKRNKLKRNKKLPKAHGSPKRLKKSKSANDSGTGYCVTCKRHYAAISPHLCTKLSSPVFKCSQCTFGYFSIGRVEAHISRACGPGAKAVRIRSKVDVAAEMRQLRQIHLGAAPRDWPYRCTECKIGIYRVSYHILRHHLKFECPVCGWSGDWRRIQMHMRKKNHQSRPIWNEAKFREQIREIQDAFIVSNK